MHWSTLLHRSQCLLGEVVGMYVKNSAMRFFQEEKKVKAENTVWAGGKKEEENEEICVSATTSAVPSSSWILLRSFSCLTYKLVPVLSFRTSFTISQMCKGMGWWRSLMPKEMMHGRCISMRQPKRSWMNLQCVMALSQYTRPWRKMHFPCSLVQIIGVTNWCDSYYLEDEVYWQWKAWQWQLLLMGLTVRGKRLPVLESLVSSKSRNYCLPLLFWDSWISVWEFFC